MDGPTQNPDAEDLVRQLSAVPLLFLVCTARTHARAAYLFFHRDVDQVMLIVTHCIAAATSTSLRRFPTGR